MKFRKVLVFYTKFSLGGFLNYTDKFFSSLTTEKAYDKIFVCKFSKKNVKSKLYHIENSKTRGQTV